MTVISRQQITTSATPTIGDFLQLLPEQGNATNTQVNNGGDGSTQISLRSLGSQRTLVLLDGRRMVAYAGATVVDINTIPTGMVDHIEVLKDGASAVYGSDAIGGVVNIITRRRLNSTEVSFYGGTSQHGDGQVLDFNVVSGASGDKGNFMVGGGYFNQYSMLAANRDWAAHALSYDYSDPTNTESPGGSSRIPAGRISINPGSAKCTTQVCKDLAAAFGSKTQKFMYDPTASNAVDGFRPFTANDFYNYQAVNYLITPSQRYQLFTNGEYRLGENARAYFQGTFVNRQSSNLLAPEPLDVAGLGITFSKSNPYNPFGMDVGSLRKRLVSASGRSAASDLDTYRVVGGVDGTFPEEFGPLKNFVWDTSFQYGRSVGTVVTNGSVNAIKVAQALGPAFPNAQSPGGYQCGTPTNPVAGCVPANPFGASNPTGDQLSSLGFEQLVNHAFSQQVDYNASVTGELFTLASERPAGIAVGYEYRRLFGGFTPDAIASQTFTNPNGFNVFVDSDYGSAATRGSYNVHEGYGELIIPLVSGLPGVEDLELQGAARVFNYSTFGRDSTYKIGGRYRPVRDITIRATYSTAFRAPSINELYGGRGPSAESATDPCAHPTPGTALYKQCGGPSLDDNVQINSNVGGTATLTPEKSKAYTVGAVIEPQMLRGFSLTADYYHINVTNTIGNAGTQNILNACYTGDPTTSNDALCKQVQRDPVSNQISVVNDYNLNLGSLTTAGVDVSARYSLPMADLGRLGFVFDANYLIQQDQFIFSLVQGAGNYDLGVNPRIKFNAGVNYAVGGFGAGVLGHFIGGFWECPNNQDLSNTGGQCSNPVTDPAVIAGGTSGTSAPNHRVKPEMTFDVFANYALKDPIGTTTFGVGVRNALNTNPVRVYNSFLTYADPSAYDFVGRFVYARVGHNF